MTRTAHWTWPDKVTCEILHRTLPVATWAWNRASVFWSYTAVAPFMCTLNIKMKIGSYVCIHSSWTLNTFSWTSNQTRVNMSTLFQPTAVPQTDSGEYVYSIPAYCCASDRLSCKELIYFSDRWQCDKKFTWRRRSCIVRVTILLYGSTTRLRILHRHTHRQINTQRQTHRQIDTDTQTDRHRDIHTDR